MISQNPMEESVTMTLKNAKALRLLALVGALLLSAIGGLSAQDSAGNVLRVGTNAPQSLEPASNSNDSETLFIRTIYDYLIEQLPDGSLAPNLAALPEISEDGLTYTFTLVEGATFHDGSPFTSADVVFTFNRLKELESPSLSLLGEFEVSAPDESTVVFTLPAPNADFLTGVASRWAVILKDGATTPNVVDEDGSLSSFNGTGPFKLESYSVGERAVFVRNEDYWKEDAPLLDGVELVFIDDPQTQVNALLDGSVDFIFKVPPSFLSQLEGSADVNVIQIATSQHPVIRLRADEGVGSDVRVRQAFKLATNREELLEVVQEGLGVIGNNDPISPVFGDLYPGNIENSYDPEAAKALLTEAGYPDGISLTLYTPDSLGYADLATVLQQQWAQAGINVEIEVRPETVYYSTDEWSTVELGITGWGARPSPQQVLLEAYASDGIYNESHWADEELDALIEQAGVTTDPAARAEIYGQIAQIFNERGPVIVPWFAEIIAATRANVQGLEIAPFPGSTDFRNVSLQ
jgi:peptide/nickel transport system substrate-binding protein